MLPIYRPFLHSHQVRDCHPFFFGNLLVKKKSHSNDLRKEWAFIVYRCNSNIIAHNVYNELSLALRIRVFVAFACRFEMYVRVCVCVFFFFVVEFV